MRKMMSFILVLCLLALSALTPKPVFAEKAAIARAAATWISFDGESQVLDGFNIGGSNYYKLRDIAENLSGSTSQFNVTFNKSKNAVEILTGRSYAFESKPASMYYSKNQNYKARFTDSKVLIDGELQLLKAYNIDGSNYFQLRDLAQKLSFKVAYDQNAGQILVLSKPVEHSYRADFKYQLQDNAVSSYFPRWKETVQTNLVQNKDQTISVIEAGEKVTIETYDKQYTLISHRSLPFELPIFGGFYSGETYNYIAFGQENKEENNQKEVIRIVRYDKEFNRLNSVSVTGGESFTITPFQFAAGRMEEHGDKLVFHTSRLRYTTADGLNHQSQLTLIVNTPTMTVVNDLGQFQTNHVGHSFDQYVLFDGSQHVLLDHGDAFPRSVVLQKENGSRYTEVELYQIPGSIGANMTGVSIGGFKQSSSHYLTAMNTVDHSLVRAYTSFEMVGLKKDQRDIIISAVPKNNLNNSAVRHITLAKYTGSQAIGSIPKIVKLSDQRMMVLWQEFDMEGTRENLKYVFINGEGTAQGSVQTKEHFVLSETDPAVIDNQVVWYTNEHGQRKFYTIPLAD
ncbi:hypothetical protein [Paenibacillus lemnae]|uniref:Copper amine oxidase-like N-terminal domain-containing protein n=1 Tax=Paenibacillus lemnae TaxID=1330551 RepID=A0A848M5F5_PAELE|nr:hypothetical protein [Paenibacillus lemnae]NMO95033.1 hypothetical protein [Paenibacillus lemnae]